MRQRRWVELLIVLILAMLAAVFVRAYILTAYKIPSGSMQPTLLPGDFVFASRIAFGWQVQEGGSGLSWGAPRRGDVVVFSYPHDPKTNYIKRVIAIGGDKLEIRAGRIRLNDQDLRYQDEVSLKPIPSPELFHVQREFIDETSYQVIFAKSGSSADFGPIQIPPNEFFLMGDNRDTSDDSRTWGTVPLDHISGKVPGS